MVTASAEIDRYRARFQDVHAAAGRPAWLGELGGRAFERFESLGFPTRRDERWRFTDVSSIARTEFEPASTAVEQDADRLESTWTGPQLTFVNGRLHARTVDTGSLPDGVVLASLRELLGERPELVEPHLGRLAVYEHEAFVALNTALFDDGLALLVPDGATLEAPILVTHVTVADTTPVAAHPRQLVVLGRGADASVVERFVGRGPAPTFTNPVTELRIGEGATLRHAHLVSGHDDARLVGCYQAEQSRDSVLRSTLVQVGGGLTRLDARTRLADTGADATMDGLYLGRGRQHVDNHTTIDHASPHCRSSELFKGVLAGASSAVFNGEVIVRQDAQKTYSRQSNRNLLLSDDATINTKPELQIEADDVRCTHGATIGRLDEDALFYLRARGIGPDAARLLLIQGFAEEVLGAVQVPELREQLGEALVDWLARAELGEGTA